MLKKTTRLIHSYRPLFELGQGLAPRALVLCIVAGVLEGSALLLLIPLINQFTAANTLSSSWLPNELQFGAGVLVCFALALLYAAASAKAQNFLADFEFGLMRELLNQAMRALYACPWPRFLELKSGEIEKAVLLESHRLALGARQLLFAMAQMAVAFAMLALCGYISVALTAIAGAIAIFGTWAYFRTGYGMHASTSNLTHAESALANEIGSLVSNFKFYRLWDSAGTMLASLEQQFARYAGLHSEVQHTQNRMRMWAEFCAVGALFGFLALGFFLGVPPGNLIVFLAIFYRLVPRLLGANSLLIAAEVELRFLPDWKQRMARLKSESASPRTAALPFTRDICVENAVVHLGGKNILSGVSFSIAKGECIAIVGESGAGKSALLDVLCGLLPLQSGSVRIDGEDLGPGNCTAWRSQIGVVLQHNPILAGTLAENIAWGEGAIDQEKLSKILDIAALNEFAGKLPQGVHTSLGRGARSLSGGEEQRIAIARALYRAPQILLLDEPTSALDAAAEDSIAKTLARIRGHCTMVIITHRLNLAQMADRVMVMKDGLIIESGTWKELIENSSGKLYNLAKLQDFKI